MTAQINFKLVKSPAAAADYLVKRLREHLDNNQRVLWLVAGGSALSIARQASEALRDYQPIKNLTITLSDERFGPVGHSDSNWKQLIDTGFELPGARLIPVLHGAALASEAESYGKMLNKELKNAQYSLALAGMGADGHIFGIKPRSPAIKAAQDVIGYEWDDYVRLTPTFKLINQLDEVIVYAAGKAKHRQFDMLEKGLSPAGQPAQLLKRLRKVTILNDYKGDVA